MTINYNPKIVTDGLVLALDAANPKSFSNFSIGTVGLGANGALAKPILATAEKSHDLYLAFLSSDLSYSSTNSVGYTEIYNANNFNGTSTVLLASSRTHSKFVSGVECLNSSLIVIPFRGVNYHSHEVSSINSKTSPAINCVSGDVLVIALYYQDLDLSTPVTPPSGYTLISNNAGGSGVGGSAGVAIAYKSITTSGIETPGDWTITTSLASDVHLSMSILLKPTWFDLSGNNYHATLFNNPTFDNTIKAFVLDNTDDYIILNSNLNLDALGASYNYTVMCGAKKLFYGTGGNNVGNSSLLQGVASGYSEGWRLWESNTGTPGNAFSGTSTYNFGAPDLGSSISISDTIANRTSIVAVARSSLQFYAFLNGNTRTDVETNTSYVNGTNSGDIGRDRNGVGRFGGNIHFIMIYNRALTPAEIEQNFNTFRGRFGI